MNDLVQIVAEPYKGCLGVILSDRNRKFYSIYIDGIGTMSRLPTDFKMLKEAPREYKSANEWRAELLLKINISILIHYSNSDNEEKMNEYVLRVAAAELTVEDCKAEDVDANLTFIQRLKQCQV